MLPTGGIQRQIEFPTSRPLFSDLDAVIPVIRIADEAVFADEVEARRCRSKAAIKQVEFQAEFFLFAD